MKSQRKSKKIPRDVVCTGLTYTLHPVPTILLGRLALPGKQHHQLAALERDPLTLTFVVGLFGQLSRGELDKAVAVWAEMEMQ